MNKNILVVLGSPNSPKGELNAISKSRLDYCKQRFKKGDWVICTGGWGPQFNTAKHPHAYYAKNYLIENGLLDSDFLEPALSKHTVDDAIKLIPILSKLNKPDIAIITSDYHIERVELIFKEILKDYQLQFVGVKSNLNKTEYNLLVEHEKKSVKSIIDNGLYY